MDGKYLLGYHVTSSFNTEYVLNDHEDLGQHHPYAVPSKILPCYSYPASLVDVDKQIPIKWSY